MRRTCRPLLLMLLIIPLSIGATSSQIRRSKSQTDHQKPVVRGSLREPLTRDSKAKLPRPNLAKVPTLYVVGYAHLDTEWRWEYPQVIQEYLTKTMRNNFALFEKYPHYVFNFTGANRYRLMKEYYPSDFERLKQYVAAGRWFPAGSSMEEGDVNSPSAESIIRQILYGNNWFRKEFGIASDEYMLPDCFGFPASLPSILAHSGIKGFSTQKLSATWQPAPHVGGPDSPEKTPEGIPFNVGIWEGPDGQSVIAALNPLSYGSQVTYDLSKTPPPPPGPDPGLTAQQNQSRSRGQEDWTKRIQINGELTGIFADYHYVGTGDVGGSPNENSVRLMEAITAKTKTRLPPAFQFGQPTLSLSGPVVQVGDGPINVVWSRADQMFQDILNCCATNRLPRYKGDLELINHSAGSLTSQAYQKRWMRKNELLADAAEKASVVAEWLGGPAYPRERLNNAWTLVMGGQFHDLLPGTATPKAFEFAWNDDVIAMNQFAGVLTGATNAVAAGLDTQVQGTAIVVYNPLSIERGDIVEATVSFPNGLPRAVRVAGPDGNEVPAQLANGKIVFLARVPSVGYSVYDVLPAETPGPSTLKVTESSLENSRYRVNLDPNGDVSGIFDKKINRELLSAPIRLAISTDNPRQWPAWNMDFEDEQRAPRTFAGGPAKIRVVESGPVRIAVEVDREAEGSRFIQTISLSAGDAGIQFSNVIDWQTKQANLKAVFSLAAANKLATYNWDIGTVQRPNAAERQFEVASHQWIDLSDESESFGATVLTDCKNGSDKPDDRTIRLTLVRTPGTRGGYADQGTQDLGHHEIVFGIAGHAAGWRQSRTDWQAYRLNQPLIAFQSPRHPGPYGKSFSLVKVNNDRVRVLALKKAEASDEVILRLVEMDGARADNVRIAFSAPISAAREVNGQEQPVGPAAVRNGELVASFANYQPRTFALKLAPARSRIAAVQSVPVPLDCDLSVASRVGRPADGSFDWTPNNQGASQGGALPAEVLPREIDFAGIRFNLAAASKPNAILSRGQTINLPAGKYNRLYLLMAAINGDQKGTFRVGDKSTDLTIQEWTGFIGQWDNRIWKTTEETIQQRPGAPASPAGTPVRTRLNPYGEMLGLRPGFIKRADVAWYSSQRRAADGRAEPYAYSYLFAYALDVPAGARTLVLPDNERIRILAVTVVDEPWVVTPAQPLYDTLERNDR